MRSSEVDELDGWVPPPFPDASLICADDMFGGEFADYAAGPLTVAEIVLEIDLAGTGPEAVRLLASLADLALTPDQALAVAAGWERQSRWVAARRHAANLAFVGVAVESDRDGDRAQTSRVLELGLVTDSSDLFLTRCLHQSRTLATVLTATAGKLASGELSEFRVRRICEKLDGLDPQVAREIEAKVLPTAGQIRLSSLTAKLRRLVLGARGDAATAEHLQGLANRRVVVDTESGEPGLLGLHAYLPPQTTIAVRQVLEAKAAEFAQADQKRVAQDKAAGEQESQPLRGKDQRMADALAWYVLGPDEQDTTAPARPAVRVQVTLSLLTLLHLADGAGELPGYGPIPADIARLLAQDADWQRFVHDPVTGHLLDLGNTTYRPSAELRRFVQARDVHDRFPGSNRSAYRADADHIQPYEDGAGGDTSAANLQSLSRKGHTAKTHNGWTCTGNANGILTWTSQHGATRWTRPHEYHSDDPERDLDPDDDPPPY